MVKNIPSPLRYYYKMSSAALTLCLRYLFSPRLKSVYAKPYSYTTAINTIGLMVFIKSGPAQDDAAFFKKFRRFYIILRIFFPALCKLGDIRFTSVERLPRHPLKQNPENRLLLEPEQWGHIYSDAPDRSPLCSVFAAEKNKVSVHTLFLEFILYGILQREIVALWPLPLLTPVRLKKSTVKILQYIYYQKTGSYICAENVARDMAADNLGRYIKERQIYTHLFSGSRRSPTGGVGGLARLLREVLLVLEDVHLKKYDLAGNSRAVAHTPSPSWMSPVLEEYIQEGKRLFGEGLRLVIFQTPLCFKEVKVFQLIYADTKKGLIEEWIRFTRRYRKRFRNADISIFATTEALLTSQFYTLWSHVALEAYLIPSQCVYTPEGRFRIKEPPEEWTLYKIRDSVSMFEEYAFSHTISSNGKGAGADFCNIYKMPSIKMLFQYYYYLKDKDAYLQDVKGLHADPSNMLCAVCARYGDEIGIDNWHPAGGHDFYPYMRRVARLVDEMALDRLAPLNQERLQNEAIAISCKQLSRTA